ncbi:phage tail tube protein [Sphingobacterium sp. UBA6645]|uniref:phage tail tube protein n=1 Tax=Sphingobacterium sp. UBA6645 TaxID=1947511 RepID=UPI0025F42AA0|nr:phage tail tube protein [Sphingobacterium sp. UBA6645]
MNNSKILGKMMGVAVGDNFISCETECTLNFEGETLPKESVESGKWAEFLYGKKTWSISVSGLLLKREVGADFKTLFTAFINDEILTVYFRTRIGVDQFLVWSGKAIIKSGIANAPRQGFANWSIVFQGTGPLDFNWEEYFAIINAMPAAADQPNIVDTREWGT